jgi:hypothetical protein
MANVMVRTNLWNELEFMALCEKLGDDKADCFLLRLWAWVIDTNNVEGVGKFTPRQLAKIVRYDGDPDVLWGAMTDPDCRYLIPLADGRHRVRGAESMNKRYFVERDQHRERQAKYRNKKRDENGGGGKQDPEDLNEIDGHSHESDASLHRHVLRNMPVTLRSSDGSSDADPVTYRIHSINRQNKPVVVLVFIWTQPRTRPWAHAYP